MLSQMKRLESYISPKELIENLKRSKSNRKDGLDAKSTVRLK
jgi:hypothetical protein